MPLQSSHMMAGIACRRYELKVGEAIEAHAHLYDHLSILASGKVEMNKTVYDAPTQIVIHRGMMHTVTALEPSTWYCIASLAHVEEAGRMGHANPHP